VFPETVDVNHFVAKVELIGAAGAIINCINRLPFPSHGGLLLAELKDCGVGSRVTLGLVPLVPSFKKAPIRTAGNTRTMHHGVRKNDGLIFAGLRDAGGRIPFSLSTPLRQHVQQMQVEQAIAPPVDTGPEPLRSSASRVHSCRRCKEGPSRTAGTTRTTCTTG
jgi:hypothetical protein